MNATYSFSVEKYFSENKYNASKLANFKENFAEIESKINEVAKSFEEKGQTIREITIVLIDNDDIVIEVAYRKEGINYSTERVIQLTPMPNKCVLFRTMMSFSDFIEDFSEFLGIKVRVHPVHPSFAYADKNDFAKCQVTKEELEEWEVKKTSESYLKKYI